MYINWVRFGELGIFYSASLKRNVAKKLIPRVRVVDCCTSMVVGENEKFQEYLKILTRGGLTTAPNALSDNIRSCFPILDAIYPTIRRNERHQSHHPLLLLAIHTPKKILMLQIKSALIFC